MNHSSLPQTPYTKARFSQGAAHVSEKSSISASGPMTTTLSPVESRSASLGLKIVSQPERRTASAGRLNYGQAKDQQLPNGSGIIESTVRRVLNLRMKGASIFWTKDNAEDMILLRAYYQSGH